MTNQTTIGRIKDAILDFIFPASCIGCGAEGKFLCSSCRDLLLIVGDQYCKQCGDPSEGGGFCSKCINLTFSIDGVRSVFLHQSLAREVVHALKYNNRKSLAQPMAELMASYLTTHPFPFDAIVPVPLHQKRLRQRGYNQSGLIVKELGQLIEIPVLEGLLTRKKNTHSQVSLGARERQQNVEGAFQCKKRAFNNKKVLLIDDVATTGATLDACARSLKEAEAVAVWGLTFSRDVKK